MGRDEYNKAVFDRSKEFKFSLGEDYSIGEIQKAVDLLEKSYLVPPPMCLAHLLFYHLPTHYYNFCCNLDAPEYPRETPLKLRGDQKKIIEALNEFIHAGGKEWIRLEERKANKSE